MTQRTEPLRMALEQGIGGQMLTLFVRDFLTFHVVPLFLALKNVMSGALCLAKNEISFAK